MSYSFVAGELQWCPCCGQRWPKDAEHHLRAMRWMHEPPLRFGITASNIDAAIHSDHDGRDYGRDRFLILEIKKPGDDVAAGQMRLLRALSRRPDFTVVLLQGTERRVVAERVTPNGLSGRPVETIPGEVRAAAARFVEGADFRPQPAEPTRSTTNRADRCFTCGARPTGRFSDGSPRYDCASAHMELPA